MKLHWRFIFGAGMTGNAGPCCAAGEPLRYGGLQRLGQLLRAVEDGDDVDAIALDSIDQTIREDDQLTEVSIIVRRHDASGVRMID